MEPSSNAFNSNQVASSKMVVLDYLIGEGVSIDAYQLLRFSEGEPQMVLSDGLLLATLLRVDGHWKIARERMSSEEQVFEIGHYINQQHFNLLPGRIKVH